jgi:ABC-type sugar transport system permease subunit
MVLLSPEHEFIGFKNYVRTLTDPAFWESLKNSFMLAIGAGVLGHTFLGLLMALILHSLFKGKRIASVLWAIVLFSWVLPDMAGAYMWFALYDYKYGAINSVLRGLGLEPIRWISPPLFVLAVVIANIWKGSGWPLVFFTSALEAIPQELYDVAEVDGAGRLQKFRYITLPLLKFAMFLAIIILFMGSFGLFVMIYNLIGPQWETGSIEMFIYSKTWVANQISYSSAVSLMVAPIFISLAVIQHKVSRLRV